MSIDPRFIVQLKGKDYPTWPGVLDAATKAGLRSLRTTIVQMPAAENGHMAIVLVRAEFEDGRVFESVGDASPANCSPQIATAALRMAETRAAGRACRNAINVGQTMLEEIPDDERQAAPLGANGSARRAAVVPDQSTEPAPLSAGADIAIKHGPICEVCSEPLTPNLYRAAIKNFSRPLCLAHGKAELGRQQEERLAAERATAVDKVKTTA